MELIRILCTQLSVLADSTGDAERLADAIAVTDGGETLALRPAQLISDLEATASVFLGTRGGQRNMRHTAASSDKQDGPQINGRAHGISCSQCSLEWSDLNGPPGQVATRYGQII